MSDDPKPPADQAPTTPPSSEAPRDVVLVHGVTPDGGGLQVLRARAGQLEAGAMYPAREGQPIRGELVQLRPRGVLVQRQTSPERTDSGAPPAASPTEPHRAPQDPKAIGLRPNDVPRALVCDVQVLWSETSSTPTAEPAEAAPGRRAGGPAKVTSDAYRESWERIFGRNSGGSPAGGNGTLN